MLRVNQSDLRLFPGPLELVLVFPTELAANEELRPPPEEPLEFDAPDTPKSKLGPESPPPNKLTDPTTETVLPNMLPWPMAPLHPESDESPLLRSTTMLEPDRLELEVALDVPKIVLSGPALLELEIG